MTIHHDQAAVRITATSRQVIEAIEQALLDWRGGAIDEGQAIEACAAALRAGRGEG